MRTFHDAVIVRFTALNNRIVIDINEVSNYDESESSRETGKLIVEGVSCFMENHKQVDAPTFSFDDGQILDLEDRRAQLKIACGMGELFIEVHRRRGV
jgi:hypothetical protein